MSAILNCPSIQATTATLCHLIGIDWPQSHITAPLESILSVAKQPFTKLLIYAPDALGTHLYHHDPALFVPFERHTQIKVALQAVLPPVTPVCFGSMYSGLSPHAHGIIHYQKPVLNCQTLFDYALAAGKSVAIVAVENSSIDLIFRERPLDYYSEPDDAAVLSRALEVIESNQHDLILVYQQDYDDQLHDKGPFHADALQAVKQHGTDFELIAHAVATSWKDNYAIVVTPDHGGHVVAETGLGDHGLDIIEDLAVDHYYGLYVGH